MNFAPNPMVRRELRLHLRERRGWLLITLYLCLLAGVVLATYQDKVSRTDDHGGTAPSGAEIGENVFYSVAYTQLALLLLLAPIYSAARLTIEKEQQTMSSLMVTLLTPSQIWWGKYSASLLFLVLLLASSMPALGMAFALGGVEPVDVVKILGATLLILATVCSSGIYFSSTFRRSVHSTAVSYIFVLVLTVLTFISAMLIDERAMDSSAAASSARALLYFNPFFFITSLIETWEEPLDLAGTLMAFCGMALLAAGLAMRNLRRTHTQI
jgi:ABC-type transport system involved in multi-copper enzyme maturation permease subunit